MARTTEARGRARSRRKGDEPRGRTPRDSETEQQSVADDAIDRGTDRVDDSSENGGVFSELKNVASDAALAVLAPVAKQAATSAAKYAVKRAPELLEDTVKPMLEDSGGLKGLATNLLPEGGAGGVLAKLTPGGGDEDGGGDAGDGTGQGRRMPVQQAVDVAAPIDIVYDQWTQFEDYPRFMHRVQRVEQRDDTSVVFHAKMWGISRSWEAEIVEQRPDERIVFESAGGVQLTGVVTFHELAERLTRVEVNIDVEPDGPIEKIARGARFIKRATRGDLKRFKAFVEMHEEETGAWRGEIEEGDVVAESDDYEDDESRYEDEEYEEEPEGEFEEEEAEEEDGKEEEDDDRQPTRSGSSRRSPSSSGSSGSRSTSKSGSRSTSKSGSRSTSKSRRGGSNGSSSRSRGSGGSGSSRSRSGSGRSRGGSSGRSKAKGGKK